MVGIKGTGHQVCLSRVFLNPFMSELLGRILKIVILTVCCGYGIFLAKFAITIL